MRQDARLGGGGGGAARGGWAEEANGKTARRLSTPSLHPHPSLSLTGPR